MYKYKVVVADDEIANVNGVVSLLNGYCPAVEVTETFSNGRAVIEYLKNNSADIAILDIKMPDSDGLDVADYIFENKLPVSVIIMTGYKEFEYAKRAINSHVAAFLEKPVNLKLMIDKINEICKSKDEKAQLQISASKRYLEENSKFNQCFKLYYFGVYSYDEFKNSLKDLYPIENICSVVNFSIENQIKCDENFFKGIAQTENEELASFLLAHYGNNADFLVTTFTNSIDTIEEYISATKKLIEFSPEIKCKVKFEIYENLKSINTKKISETANLITECLISGNKSDLELINDVISYYSPNLLKQLLNAFLDTISENINVDRNYYIGKFNSCSDLNDRLKVIYELEEIYTKELTRSEDTMRQIVSFIYENIDKNISLRDVAKKFSFNYSYFSRFFKEKTGMTFSDFLLEARMEKAKELISQGKYKIERVASMVGYNKYSYFGEQFKKYTGRTPSQYSALKRLKNNEKQ